MKHLQPFTLFESKVTLDEFDRVLNELTDLIKGDDKMETRHKKHLISTIYSKKDKTPQEIKEELWKDETIIKSKSELNKLISKVLPLVKNFNVTKFKQLLKALTSQTTGKKVKQ